MAYSVYSDGVYSNKVYPKNTSPGSIAPPEKALRAPATGLVTQDLLERVHLIGVAGTGLRGMARILSQRGVQVSGSEASDSPTIDSLRRGGVRCEIGHRGDNLPKETELVVASAAIRDDNPELRAARHRGIPVLKYAQLLGRLMAEKQGIGIAGTHGKTTTTAMASHVLLEDGHDPSFIVGGDCPDMGGSARWGNGDLLVAEACEFDRSFLNLRPRYAVVTNIEEEHLDYFRSLREIQSAFADFVAQLPEDGYLVLNGDDPQSRGLSEHAPSAVGRFSLGRRGGDWWARDIRADGGGVAYTAVSRTGEDMDVRLRVPGTHNVKNSLAVIVLVHHLGLSLESIALGLETFGGVNRRFEVLTDKPFVIVDDYAHHPTEIEATLQAARQVYPDARLRAVFQPHQFSRTAAFLERFSSVLSSADEVVITDVFAARDTDEDRASINSGVLVDGVNGRGGNACFAPSFDFVEAYLEQTAGPQDVVLCMGAGSVTQLAHQLAGAFGSTEARE
jgi:UDP-N-acetylmuramate--alanine ligase